MSFRNERPGGVGTSSIGMPYMVVTVDSIDGDYAMVSDQWRNRRQIDLRIRRGKFPGPEVGETWLIDRSLGMWSFAGIMNYSGEATTYSRHIRVERSPGIDILAESMTDQATAYAFGQKLAFTTVLQSPSYILVRVAPSSEVYIPVAWWTYLEVRRVADANGNVIAEPTVWTRSWGQDTHYTTEAHSGGVFTVYDTNDPNDAIYNAYSASTTAIGAAGWYRFKIEVYWEEP